MNGFTMLARWHGGRHYGVALEWPARYRWRYFRDRQYVHVGPIHVSLGSSRALWPFTR